MARRPGPLDGGKPLGTYELLMAIAEHGPNWPAALAHYPIEAVSVAIAREIFVRNLADGVTLTDQGRAALARLQKPADERSGRLDVRPRSACATHPGGVCWRVVCTDCGRPVAEHVPDLSLTATVLELGRDHRCDRDGTTTPPAADLTGV